MGLLFRLAFFTVALVGAALLFIYAAVIAVIFIPVALILFFVLRKKGVIRWTTVDLRNPPGPQYRPSGQPPSGQPPVIDHDPNDTTLQR
jgi:hypothetical protein